MRKYILPVVMFLCIGLGIGSRYIPDIEIGPKPDPKPTPVVHSDVWSSTKTYLLLQRDGFNKVADKLDAKEITTNQDMLDFLSKSCASADSAAYADIRQRDQDNIGKVDVSKPEDSAKASAYWRKIATEYDEAARE